MANAQASIELIITVGFMLLIFLMVSMLALQKTVESHSIKLFLDAKKVTGSFSDNINTIAGEGGGYYRYFSVPATIYGDREYNITVAQNSVEISGGDFAYSTLISSANVTVYCLDKGENATNRIVNNGGEIVITCFRPNLLPVSESAYVVDGEGNNKTLRVTVKNAAQVASPFFLVAVNGSTVIPVAGIPEESEVVLNYTLVNPGPGAYTVLFEVDYDNAVEESIESDNNVNVSFEVA